MRERVTFCEVTHDLSQNPSGACAGGVLVCVQRCCEFMRAFVKMRKAVSSATRHI